MWNSFSLHMVKYETYIYPLLYTHTVDCIV